MAGMTAPSVLVAFLVATAAALPSTLLEDTKQAAMESEPIISKGKEKIKHHASSLQVSNFMCQLRVNNPHNVGLRMLCQFYDACLISNPDFILFLSENQGRVL
jgi:hypothetical protein